MKRILSALVLVMVLAGSAFGLSDKEYTCMKNRKTICSLTMNDNSQILLH